MAGTDATTVVPIACADLAQLQKVRSAIASCLGFGSEAGDTGLLLALCIAVGNLERLRIFELRAAAETIGWLVGVREVTRAALRFGPITLLSYAQPRLRILGDYGFIRSSVCCDTASLHHALISLLQNTRDYDAIFLQAVSTESIFREPVTSLRASRVAHVRTDYPERTRHRLVPKATFDVYLQALSKSTRQTFKYSLKKLREFCGGELTLGVYDTPESIQSFVAEASQVAQTSYQQQRLGLGFTNQEGVTTRLRIAAEVGWTKSFVLRCRGAPVAYIEGYLAGGTWIAYQIGFAAEWASRSVGTVCQLEAIKHLMDAAPVKPHAIDYLEGDDDYKRRLCNFTTTETSFLITRRSFRANLQFHAQELLEAIFRAIWRAANVVSGWRTGHAQERH